VRDTRCGREPRTSRAVFFGNGRRVVVSNENFRGNHTFTRSHRTRKSARGGAELIRAHRSRRHFVSAPGEATWRFG
jgi:hypothetical protein